MKTELSEEEFKHVTEAILSGNKIHAIKLYREFTGQGLVEGKKAVEAITAKLVPAHPELKQKNSAGFSTLTIALIIGIVIYLLWQRFG